MASEIVEGEAMVRKVVGFYCGGWGGGMWRTYVLPSQWLIRVMK